MLLLDSLFCVLTFIAVIASLTKYLHMRFLVLAGAGLVLLTHLYFESFRWQMVPAYCVLLLASLLILRRVRSKPMVAVGSLFILVSAGLSISFPVFDLPDPDGPFPVGVTKRHFVDDSRAEVQTGDDTDRREIGLRIWYPAAENHVSHGSYWVRNGDRDSALARGLNLPDFMGVFFSHIALIETNSSSDVAVAAGSFPILIFSHGLHLGTSEQNTVLMEHLASHGYIVFSVDHAYWGLYYKMPDGRVALSDKVQENFRSLFELERTDELDNLPLHIEQSLEQLTAQLERAEEILVKSTAANQVGIDVWSADQRFVLDLLPIINKEDALLRGKLIADQVGIFGMSFGGTTSVQTCIIDSRCVAGANIDGFQLNLLNLPALGVPFLILGETKFEWQRITLEKSESDAFLVRIADTEHANFTDFAVLSPLLIGTPLLGAIDPTHGLDLINLFVKAFFDKYLLQKEGIASIKMLANEEKLVRLDSKNVP